MKSMISFSMVLGEVMEQIPYKAISKHMKGRKVIGSSQQGFRMGKSCLTNLIALSDEETALQKRGGQWMLDNLIFRTGFVPVCHSLLVASSQQGPQGLAAGPILFNVSSNDRGDGLKYILCKCVHNTKLGRVLNVLEGRATLQRVLERLKKWAEQTSWSSTRPSGRSCVCERIPWHSGSCKDVALQKSVKYCGGAPRKVTEPLRCSRLGQTWP